LRPEDLIGEANIADKLTDDELAVIAKGVIDGYDIDKASRADWERTTREAQKVAMQVFEERNFPFEKSSSMKYPLMAVSAIQFAARAYPNFVKAPDVVRAIVVGDDPNNEKSDAADRVSRHMSYQLLHEMEEWEAETDKLLSVLPISGLAFKKHWYDPVLGRNRSEYRSAWDIVVNYWAKSLSTVPRLTELYVLYPNEVEERVRAGLFSRYDYGSPLATKEEDEETTAAEDPEQPHVFMEQHTYLDLDDDGYKEPYIVVVHKDTEQVARIVPRFDAKGVTRNSDDEVSRIAAKQYFTKYSFMPAMDGSFYDIGFGVLLTPINKVIDSVTNQIVDSGTLYNLNAGFLGKGVNLGRGRGGGELKFSLGEWKSVGFIGDDLRKNIVPLPAKEPSMVLFNMLGFMVTAGEKLASVSEILTGQQSNESERPTTTLARIEQGLTVFSSIHKRLYYSFRREFKALFVLNYEHLDPKEYFRVLDSQTAILRSDYNYETCDIVPIADPNETTGTQKLLKAQILMGMVGQGFNDEEIKRRFLEAMQIPDAKKLLDAPPPPQDPKIMLEAQKLQLEVSKFQFEMSKNDDDRREIASRVQKNVATAIKALADAEATEVGPQLDQYKAELQEITKLVQIGANRDGNNGAGLPGVEAQPGNAGGNAEGVLQAAGPGSPHGVG